MTEPTPGYRRSVTILVPPTTRPDPLGPGHPRRLPLPRGPVTEQLLDHLVRPVHELPPLPLTDADPLTDDDLALALYLCYELHYLGLPDVDEAWEWEPTLLRERRRLEHDLERRLVEVVGHVPVGVSRDRRHRGAAAPGVRRRRSVALGLHGSSAARSRRCGSSRCTAPRTSSRRPIPTRGRSRASPAGPRPRSSTSSRGSTARADPQDVHANLFAEVMAALDLDPTYGAYLDRIPGVTLSTCNLVSLFGLHRRWRGALVGHLALFEMTSVGPMGRYQAALERMGLGRQATRFYEEHVIADERHQEVAPARPRGRARRPGAVPRRRGRLRRSRPGRGRGAGSPQHLLDSWAAGRSSLLPRLVADADAAGSAARCGRSRCRPPRRSDARPSGDVDVVVVGGGLTGLVTATVLHRAGLRCRCSSATPSAASPPAAPPGSSPRSRARRCSTCSATAAPTAPRSTRPRPRRASPGCAR